jgi:hypothetical protein
MIKQELVKEAYRKAGNYETDIAFDHVDTAFVTKFLKEYQELEMADILQFKPKQWFPIVEPVKKAKEIALDAAVKIIATNSLNLTGQAVVGVAENIYQWLIKTEPNS